KVWKQFVQGAEMMNLFHPQTEILVLDGVPRTTKQAELLDDTLDVLKIIYLVCSDMNKMVERLRRRALKENRFDDANDTVIRKRLEVYERDTRPVLDHYPADKVVQIDAVQSQIRVLSDIIKVLCPLKEEMDKQRGER